MKSMRWSRQMMAVWVVLCGSAPGLVAEVLLHDDFASFDSTSWYVPTWYGDGDGTFFGRTQLRVAQSGWEPSISSGAARLTVDSYCNDEGEAFFGTEIRTNATYLPGPGETIVSTVRFRLQQPTASGLVLAGFFFEAYNYAGNHGDQRNMADRDEIDSYEVMTRLPAGINTNVFEDDAFAVAGDTEFIPLPDINWAQWHTVETRWSLEAIAWYVDDDLVRLTTSSEIDIPDQAMEFRLNAWVPDSDWPDAFDPSLVPTGDVGANQTWFYEVDSVDISVVDDPDPLSGDANGDGVVDAADYITIKRHFGLAPSATGEDGDLDGNDIVNLADLDILIASMSASGSAVIPEPTSLSLLVLGGLAVLRCRRTRRCGQVALAEAAQPKIWAKAGFGRGAAVTERARSMLADHTIGHTIAGKAWDGRRREIVQKTFVSLK